MFAPLRMKTTLVRQSLSIPELPSVQEKYNDRLKFLAYYDFDSSIVRKNIKAPIQAFQEAFANQTDVSLTIKARGSNAEGAREWLADKAAHDPRIRIIDETLSRHAVDQLMLECDAFISLHRAEGFGFGAAEALAAGKAVISTDYSATTDFITAETGYPVKYDLIAVKEGEYPHWEDQVWADPRIDSAVGALQEIYEDREGACKKGSKGRELMERLYSPAAVGAEIKNLLLERGLI
jgi:glycosyltransferase involved in cell wall biosynthesis